MKPKEIIAQKVEDFAKNEKAYKSKDFQETEARNRFIDPLFEALGWNLNQTNIPKKLWDVHREYSQKDNSSTKKPDYAFRIDAKLKFFVEAKAPHVPLTDKDPVFQAKRYAYSTNGKAPIIILTDFEEFRVFNAMQKPVYDNPMQGVLKEFDFKYGDYLDKWDLLQETFSREAVLNGSLDRLRGKISKSTKKLDDEFLDEMVVWRENLAKHIAIKNESLTVDELNEAVQRILDRLIFIRQLEDRNIVDENTLFTFAKKTNLYNEILPLFGELNGKYNGLLFKPHFSEKLILEDKVLKETILDLCYPRSPFQFDVIEPEILGRIYERFLGSKIRLTENHRAKVEEKPEVRHAGGVYYTPEYIVNYIVKETVGKKTEGKTPEEITKIKILDPACGSGSFLLGAYQFLLNWHVDYYKSKIVTHKPEANGIDSSKKKSTIPTKFKDDFFFDADGEIKLTAKKKGEILVNNIYGVDIDREATEVAILSLYLKILEDGLEDDGYLFLKGKVLPDMTNNIKCGNSLISREDLFSNNMFTSTTLSDRTPIKAFDWEKEFFPIFNKQIISKFHLITFETKYSRVQDGNEPILLSEGNIELIINCFKETKEKFKCKFLACSILPDHVHIIVADMGKNIEDIVKHLKGNSAVQVNRRFKSSVQGQGYQQSLWAKSYNNSFLDTEEHFFNAIEYVNNNYKKHSDKWIELSDQMKHKISEIIEPFTKWEDYTYNSGGFDCVIGNPPYIRIQEMQKWAKEEVELYKKIYKSGSSNNFDIYVLFLEKAIQLLDENGKTGFILPNKFMQQEYGESIRGILSQQKLINKIINFKDFQIFENATTYTCLVFTNKKETNEFLYAEAKDELIDSISFSILNSSLLTKNVWTLYSNEDEKLHKAISSLSTVNDIADNIFVGIQTSADKVLILDYISETKDEVKLYSNSLQKEVSLEKKFIRHIVSGTDVKRYMEPPITQFVIFPYELGDGKAKLLEKIILEKETPKTWTYLLENKKVLENRESGKFKDNYWYRFGRNQNIDKQNLEKLCVPRLVQKIQCIYDEYGKYCQDNVDVGGIILKKEYKHLYLYFMGLLNSKLLSIYLSKISTPFRGGFWSCNKQYLEKLPIYIPDPSEKEKFIITQKIEEFVKQILEFRKKGNTGDAEFLEKKIDEMVEKLYGV